MSECTSNAQLRLEVLHAATAAACATALIAAHWLPEASRVRAYARCRALLAANPDWDLDLLFAHCVDAIEAAQPDPVAPVECWKCSGSGIYSWGGSHNGIPRCTGKCFNCAGKGIETPKDTVRNTHYWNLNGWSHSG